MTDNQLSPRLQLAGMALTLIDGNLSRRGANLSHEMIARESLAIADAIIAASQSAPASDVNQLARKVMRLEERVSRLVRALHEAKAEIEMECELLALNCIERALAKDSEAAK